MNVGIVYCVSGISSGISPEFGNRHNGSACSLIR
jgi:hypothetical protein